MRTDKHGRRQNLVPERNIKEVGTEVRKLDAGKRWLVAPKARKKRSRSALLSRA